MKNEKSKAKIVYWKDGSYLIVEDGITWEYDNDENWLKTLSLFDVITGYEQSIKLINDLKEKLAFTIQHLEYRIEDKETDFDSESETRLGIIVEDIKTIYL